MASRITPDLGFNPGRVRGQRRYLEATMDLAVLRVLPSFALLARRWQDHRGEQDRRGARNQRRSRECKQNLHGPGLPVLLRSGSRWRFSVGHGARRRAARAPTGPP